jgi:hypothetical protein
VGQWRENQDATGQPSDDDGTHPHPHHKDQTSARKIKQERTEVLFSQHLHFPFTLILNRERNHNVEEKWYPADGGNDTCLDDSSCNDEEESYFTTNKTRRESFHGTL